MRWRTNVIITLVVTFAVGFTLGITAGSGLVLDYAQNYYPDLTLLP